VGLGGSDGNGTRLWAVQKTDFPRNFTIWTRRKMVFIPLMTEEFNHMEKAVERITAWGIQCRTCNETIVLGTKLDPHYGDFFSFLKPGSFRCVHGHTHNYDSDDVVFFQTSAVTPVTEAEIEKNRANYELLGSLE